MSGAAATPAITAASVAAGVMPAPEQVSAPLAQWNYSRLPLCCRLPAAPARCNRPAVSDAAGVDGPDSARPAAPPLPQREGRVRQDGRRDDGGGGELVGVRALKGAAGAVGHPSSRCACLPPVQIVYGCDAERRFKVSAHTHPLLSLQAMRQVCVTHRGWRRVPCTACRCTCGMAEAARGSRRTAAGRRSSAWRRGARGASARGAARAGPLRWCEWHWHDGRCCGRGRAFGVTGAQTRCGSCSSRAGESLPAAGRRVSGLGGVAMRPHTATDRARTCCLRPWRRAVLFPATHPSRRLTAACCRRRRCGGTLMRCTRRGCRTPAPSTCGMAQRGGLRPLQPLACCAGPGTTSTLLRLTTGAAALASIPL